MKSKSNYFGSLMIGAALGTAITVSVDFIRKHRTRYDKDGFDKNGYDKEGYDRAGFNQNGYNREGMDRDGYNIDGFKDGYDKDGYDQYGFDREKFDRNGRDRRGFDRSGRNVDGYDKRGYDIEGYNKYGFDEDGFNREGRDRDGYDRYGYNSAGVDREGCIRESYEERFRQLRDYLNKAEEQLKNDEIAYALYEIRRVLEETLEQYVKHFLGSNKLGKTPEENINICEKKKLISQKVIKNLHHARRECNKDPHEINAREKLNAKIALMVLRQVESFLAIAECDLVYG